MDKCTLLSTIRQFRYLLNNSSTNLVIHSRFAHQNVSKGRKEHKIPKVNQDLELSTEPPIRIERSPTDILKALASTVGRDYTAPAYKFHDDPFLIPMSNVSKRSFALSKESGRKAAKWVRQQHAELYYHKNADPAIMDFFPDPTVQDASELNDDAINSFINLGLYSEAVKAYEILITQGKAVSPETKKSLLEMAAFYNDEEPGAEDLIEERWYKSGSLNRDRFKNTWKSNGLAEKLFLEMDPSDSRIFNVMIQGRAKYFNSEGAFELFQDAISKGIPLQTETFNSIIRIIRFIRESADLRRDLILDILSQMNQNNVQPNIGTLNAALETTSNLGVQRQSKQLALSLLSEFKRLGINPSLGSYYFILKVFCKEKGPRSNILSDILDEIEGKEFEIQDSVDVNFFGFAMDIARYHCQDIDLADRIHRMVLTGKNYDLIGDSFRESIYYRNYMIMKTHLESVDKLFEFYDKVVPNVYTPEPAVIDEILNTIELQGAINYIPQMWSDILVFDLHTRENLLTSILHIMAKDYPVETTPEATSLGAKFAEIASKIWTIIETQDPERTNPVMWSGKMLGDLMTVLVKSDNFDKASEAMKKFLAPSSKILGVPTIGTLQTFLTEAIKQKTGSMGLACIQYTNEAGFPEVKTMAEQVASQLELDSVQQARLCNIVGFDLYATQSSLANE